MIQFRHIIIYTSFQVALLTGIALSQQTISVGTNPHFLDSLLLVGDVTTYISLWDKSYSTSRMDAYNNLFKRLQMLSKSSDQEIQVMCQEVDSSTSRFQKTHAGRNAQIMFDRFIEDRNVQRWKNALAYYFIALYFREQHIGNEKLRLRKNLTIAEDLYASGQFVEVLQAVNTFRAEDQTNPAFIILGDSLSTLYDKMERESSAAKRELEAEFVIKRLTISFSGGLSSFSKHMVSFEELGFDFTPDVLPNKPKPFYSVQADYFISVLFSVGIQVKSGQIYNDDVFAEPFGTPDPARFHILEDYISIISGPTIFFREKTGLRPFVGLEAGIVSIHRNSAKLQSARWGTPGYIVKLKDVRKTYPLIAIKTGSEFEPSAHGHFYFGAYVSISNHYGDTMLIEHFVVSFEFRIGVNIF
jgi:hypothetical protein